jgi:hypothetical protein
VRVYKQDNNEQFDFLLQDMEAEDSNYRDQHMALGMKQAETAVRWLAALHAVCRISMLLLSYGFTHVFT